MASSAAIPSHSTARQTACMWMPSSAFRWPPSKHEAFLHLIQNSKEVLQCYHVTGDYTFLIKVSCGSMPQLEHLILQFQKLGTTSTQIILSTPVNHGDLEALML